MAGLALLVSGAAWPDVPRLELGVGAWQHDANGTLSSDDPLIAIPTGFALPSDRGLYERFAFRVGNRWWAPMIRARHFQYSGAGSSFEDDSTPPLIVDTTATQRQMDLDQLEGLAYFTLGTTLRAELGGGLQKFRLKLDTTQTHDTTLGGTTVATAQREMPESVRVLYGALYAEPVSWLSFGGELIHGGSEGNQVRDTTFRFVVKPWVWLGVEGGYRKLNLQGANVNQANYEFDFTGAFAGLAFLYGSKEPGLLTEKDADLDGIPDDRDRCPGTPKGATVDAAGCEPDADHDGVSDARDDCPTTPSGMKVGQNGCPTDADNDGVEDGADQCPASAAGEPVDERGCPKDADHDGIPDAQDQCPETPVGAHVDASGCVPDDKDQDGVPDELDKCPASPAGTPVDAAGCPAHAVVEPAPQAAAAATGPDADHDGVPDALDRCPHTPGGLKVDGTGCAVPSTAVLQGITFQKNSSYLMRDSEVLLLEAVEALKAQPTMKVEIQGHTCDLGPANYNKWLSQRRANRVLEFFVRHGIDATRLTAVGYGEEQPMVPNDDERMRELNRRTVFKVLQQ